MQLRTNNEKSIISTCNTVKGEKRKTHTLLTDYASRSAVPIQLYQHILKIYEGKGQLTLFND